MVSAPARRQQAAFALLRGVSQRKECALFSLARSTLCYESRMALRDAPLVAALMMALAAQYPPRYGYRRIAVFMEHEGHKMGPDKAYRLRCAAGLQVPRKRPRKRVAAFRPRPGAPSVANGGRAYNFVFDACANGQQVKCLTIVDEFRRESLAIDVAGSIRPGRVIEVLSRLVSERGATQHLRSDNGPEFVSRALLRWTVAESLDIALIALGKPWQNGAAESFNGKFRDECLSMEWFRNRQEAKVVIEERRQHYNAARPHSSLGNMTPVAYSRVAQTNTNLEATLKN